MCETLIHCEVDLAGLGRQEGYLRVPHSVDRSGYGWIPVPITVLANEVGPTIVLSAGVHGDEYEGQIAIANIARDLPLEALRGRIICLPALNEPATRAGRRVSPIDEGNLNRTYPGNARGTPTQMIAHYHEEVILPLADYAIDLHTGGTSGFYPPTLLRGPAHSPEEERGLALMTEAFDLPYAWIFTTGGGCSSTARTAMGAANRKGVVNVMAELGGGGGVSPEDLAWAERGLRRVLHALGMLPGYAPDPTRGTRKLNAKGLVPCYEAGLFEPLVDVGESVAEGQPVARLHRPDTPGFAPVVVTSPLAGLVLSRRALARAERGDALFQIADDAPAS